MEKKINLETSNLDKFENNKIENSKEISGGFFWSFAWLSVDDGLREPDLNT